MTGQILVATCQFSDYTPWPDLTETAVQDAIPTESYGSFGLIKAIERVLETLSEPARNEPVRAAQFLADAERVADSITDASLKAQALSGIAQALAATDPDRAERIANSVTHASSKPRSLSRVVRVLAPSEPNRSGRLLNSSTDASSKAQALSGIAQALAATDPDRAARLFDDAERIANSITDAPSKVSALIGVARALTASLS